MRENISDLILEYSSIYFVVLGCVYLALTYANLIPASLTGLIVSRDLFLVYAGLYIRYMSVVPPFTLQKYFDPTLPTATIQPTTISKVGVDILKKGRYFRVLS